MADRQFNPLGTVSAPADWTLPAGLQILLKGVYASFDGSGAGSGFQPAFEVITDSGHSMGVFNCDTTVAAGGSADVTWFRGLGGSGSSSAFASSWATLLDNGISVPPGSTYTQYDFTAAFFATNDGTTFTVDSTNGLKLNSNGWYQWAMTLEWEISGATTASLVQAEWNIPNIGNHGTGSQVIYTPEGGGSYHATNTQAWGFPMKAATVGSHGKLFLRQFSDATASVSLSFGIALLSNSSGNF